MTNLKQRGIKKKHEYQTNVGQNFTINIVVTLFQNPWKTRICNTLKNKTIFKDREEMTRW